MDQASDAYEKALENNFTAESIEEILQLANYTHSLLITNDHQLSEFLSIIVGRCSDRGSFRSGLLKRICISRN